MVLCCVPFCPSRSDRGKCNVSFHQFPHKDDQRSLWLKLIARENFKINEKTSRVCSLHFTQEDFVAGIKKKILIENAVPTIFPGYPPRRLPMSALKRQKMITIAPRPLQIKKSSGTQTSTHVRYTNQKHQLPASALKRQKMVKIAPRPVQIKQSSGTQTSAYLWYTNQKHQQDVAGVDEENPLHYMQASGNPAIFAYAFIGSQSSELRNEEREVPESIDQHEDIESVSQHETGLVDQWTRSVGQQKEAESVDQHKETEPIDQYAYMEVPESVDQHEEAESTDQHRETESVGQHEQTESISYHKEAGSVDQHEESGPIEQYEYMEVPESIDLHEEGESTDQFEETESVGQHEQTESFEKCIMTESVDYHKEAESLDQHGETESVEQHVKFESIDQHEGTMYLPEEGKETRIMFRQCNTIENIALSNTSAASVSNEAQNRRLIVNYRKEIHRLRSQLWKRTKKIEKFKNETKQLKDTIQYIEENESYRNFRGVLEKAKEGDFKASFLVEQIKNFCKTKPSWSERTSGECALWQAVSPEGYAHARDALLKLPSKKTLGRFRGRVDGESWSDKCDTSSSS